jgi:hypothetical protein
MYMLSLLYLTLDIVHTVNADVKFIAVIGYKSRMEGK